MAYSGRYPVKNKTKYVGDPNSVVYRSLWEKHAFKWCDNSSDVKRWASEEVVVTYLYEADKRYHRYFVDLWIEYKDGNVVMVEIKPDRETRPPTGSRRTKRMLEESLTYVKNQNKWQAANKYAKERGWKFEIWTEKRLSAMGILPKSIKPLKPFPKKIKK
jgi:hypothetical protein